MTPLVASEVHEPVHEVVAGATEVAGMARLEGELEECAVVDPDALRRALDEPLGNDAGLKRVPKRVVGVVGVGEDESDDDHGSSWLDCGGNADCEI